MRESVGAWTDRALKDVLIEAGGEGWKRREGGGEKGGRGREGEKGGREWGGGKPVNEWSMWGKLGPSPHTESPSSSNNWCTFKGPSSSTCPVAAESFEKSHSTCSPRCHLLLTALLQVPTKRMIEHCV